MDIRKLIELIEQWAIDRGLDKNGTVEGQLIKTSEEVAELIIGISKGNLKLIKDSIGDVFVTIVIGDLIEGNKTDLVEVINDYYKYQANARFEDKYECIQTLMLNYSDLLVDKTYSIAMHAKINTLIMVGELYKLDLVDCVETAYNEITDRKGRVINGTFVKEDDLI